MTFDFPGLELSLKDNALWLNSPAPLKTCSSAVVRGGFAEVYHIINLHVHKNYANPHPQQDLERYAQNHDLQKPYLGMMTAVYVEDHKTATLSRHDLHVSAVVTAGIGNAISAGNSKPMSVLQPPGTINTIVCVEGDLTPAAMINALITVTETKTAVLHAGGHKTSEGFPVTGTSTDSVVIACTGEGPPLPYAGPSTDVGWLISRAVRFALAEALA
jgi:iron complex transport system ATP-binding protein